MTTWRVKKLVDSPGSMVAYFLLKLYFTIIRRMGFQPTLPFFVPLRLNYREKKFTFYIKHQLDFDILEDTFVTQEYLLEDIGSVSIVFDLGSNIGGTVVFFKLLWPNAKIYAFEPDPRNLNSLRKNVREYGDSVVIIDKAVVPQPTAMVTFYQAKKEHWSSSTIPRAEVTSELAVEAITLEQAIEEYGIERVDVCKFDIEGAEYGVFSTFAPDKLVRVLIGEVHPQIVDKTFEEFLQVVPGFKVYEIRRGLVVVLLNEKLQ